MTDSTPDSSVAAESRAEAARLAAHEEALATPTPTQVMLRRMRGHKGLLIGAGILLVLIVLALLAPWLAPHDALVPSLSNRLLPPAWEQGGRAEYLLGTDHLGRDYLSRLLFGARISLVIGFGAATMGCLIGVSLGICAGYFGGRVDQVINYILTCQLALPGLLLTMADRKSVV